MLKIMQDSRKQLFCYVAGCLVRIQVYIHMRIRLPYQNHFFPNLAHFLDVNIRTTGCCIASYTMNIIKLYTNTYIKILQFSSSAHPSELRLLPPLYSLNVWTSQWKVKSIVMENIEIQEFKEVNSSNCNSIDPFNDRPPSFLTNTNMQRMQPFGKSTNATTSTRYFVRLS